MELPAGITQADLDAHEARQARRRAAAIQPIPPPILRALCPTGPLRQPVLWDCVVLSAWKHPILTWFIGKDSRWSKEDVQRAFCLWRNPAKAWMELPAPFEVPVESLEVNVSAEQLCAHFAAAFETALDFRPCEEKIRTGIDLVTPGWWMGLVDVLMMRYRMTWEAAMLTEISRAFIYRAMRDFATPGLQPTRTWFAELLQAPFEESLSRTRNTPQAPDAGNP